MSFLFLSGVYSWTWWLLTTTFQSFFNCSGRECALELIYKLVHSIDCWGFNRFLALTKTSEEVNIWKVFFYHKVTHQVPKRWKCLSYYSCLLQLSHTHESIPGKEQSMMLRAWSSALRLMQHHNLQEPKHNPTVDWCHPLLLFYIKNAISKSLSVFGKHRCEIIVSSLYLHTETKQISANDTQDIQWIFTKVENKQQHQWREGTDQISQGPFQPALDQSPGEAGKFDFFYTSLLGSLGYLAYPMSLFY